jgi:hypothetical protein
MTDEAGARFADVSRRMCEALELGDVRPAALQSLLAETMVAAIALPDAELDDERVAERDPDHRRISLRLQREGLATVDAGFYWNVVDPLAVIDSAGAPTLTAPEPTFGSFGDDLGDIYAGLAEGLQAWDAGRLDEAIWLWRYGFRSIWGRDICDALRVLWQLQHNAH